MNTNRPYSRQEAFEIYLSLLDRYFRAAVTEPREIGETLASTAITLAQTFSEKANQHQPFVPLPLRDIGDVKMLGHFRVSGKSVEFKIDGLPHSETLIADCKTTLTAFGVVKDLEQVLRGIHEET